MYEGIEMKCKFCGCSLREADIKDAQTCWACLNLIRGAMLETKNTQRTFLSALGYTVLEGE